MGYHGRHGHGRRRPDHWNDYDQDSNNPNHPAYERPTYDPNNVTSIKGIYIYIYMYVYIYISLSLCLSVCAHIISHIYIYTRQLIDMKHIYT